MDFEKNKESLDEVDSKYTGENTEQEISSLTQKIIDVDFPSKITEIASGEDLTYYPEDENINPEDLDIVNQVETSEEAINKINE